MLPDAACNTIEQEKGASTPGRDAPEQKVHIAPSEKAPADSAPSNTCFT